MGIFGRETPEQKARAQSYARWMQSQNPLAIASLVLGIFSLIEFGVLWIFGIGGIATGMIALKQLGRSSEGSTRGRGHGLAWAGIATSVVSLVIASLLYARVFG